LKGCLVDDEDLRELGQGKNESHVDKNYKSVGCYISISSPKDHEITTTFPLGNAKSEELNSIEGDIFHWIHCKFVFVDGLSCFGGGWRSLLTGPC